MRDLNSGVASAGEVVPDLMSRPGVVQGPRQQPAVVSGEPEVDVLPGDSSVWTDIQRFDSATGALQAGDYYDTIVRDAVTGALLQRFSDHPVTPSADGTRLFGNDGAVFCR